MRLRILFVILMVCISVSLGGALAYLTSNYGKQKSARRALQQRHT